MPDETNTYDPQKLAQLADSGSARAAAQLTMGQTRIAHLLAARAAGRLLYCKAYGWLTWAGTHWQPDDGVAARNELLALLRTAVRDNNAETVKAATQCMNDGPQRGVLNIASLLPEFYVTVEDLDSDPYLLNLANGTYDLHTHELRDHDPADRLTKVARAGYDPQASAPLWTEHLEYFQPDEQVRQFLQRFFGYALLGKVIEHVLLIAYGPKGANGKSTTDRAVQHALGDYATTANQNLLLQRRNNNADAASPALFALLGRRYVAMSETEKRAPIAEALMKNLTGGDKVTARALFKDEVTFLPSHTMCLYTNHKPKLSGDDSGVWRRVLLVPFEVRRPEAEWDSGIDEKLELEADAILTWMIEGFKQWETTGLAAPEAIRAATSEYQYEEDTTSQFLTERIERKGGTKTKAQEVWAEYEDFVRETQAEPVAKKDLFLRIENEGYVKKSVSTGYAFINLTIKPKRELPSEEMTDGLD